MKQRYWVFKRGKTFYVQDSETGEQKSLGTKDRSEALRLLEVKRQAASHPSFNQLMLKACLSASPKTPRTHLANCHGADVLSRERGNPRAMPGASASKHFDSLRNRKLLETSAEHLLSVLKHVPASGKHYLRRFYNLALGLGWLPMPILPPKLWPKIRFRDKRAITAEEHRRVIMAEKNPQRNLFYQILWEIGAAQTDAASLQAEFNWQDTTLSFQRKKTGSWSHILIGKKLAQILSQLPTEGHLFPAIALTSANDRAAEFYRRCKILHIEGISLHSYRYAWAERAKQVGYPERFAQEALGHNSKAVHRAYAKRARVLLPPIESFQSGKEKFGELHPVSGGACNS